MTDSEGKDESTQSVVPSELDGKGANVDMITGRLREFYDSVVEEGTPDFLLSLLDQLQAAEEAAREQKVRDDDR